MGHDADRGSERFIRHIVYSKLSSFELSVFRSLVFSARTLPKRIQRQWAYIVLPGAFMYLLMDYADRENWRSHRKNPADYENDE